WFFKVAPGTTDLARGVIEGIKKRNIKTLAILNATDAFGQSEVANLKKMAADAGIKIVAAETFALTDTSFTSQLVRIKAANPEFLYNGATAGPAILIYNQYQQLGLKIPMAVSLAAVSAAFFKGIGGPEKAEGILSVIPIGMVAEGAGGELERMYKECAAALGRTPIVFHTIGWDHALITAWACEKSDGTREGIRAALDTAKDVPAINGPFTFTPDNHIGQDVRGLTLAQYKAGKWTRA
ncbi:MAG: ABC transporter substrate-binding protein, partial [Alphaproteobacteria bacterium]